MHLDQEDAPEDNQAISQQASQRHARSDPPDHHPAEDTGHAAHREKRAQGLRVAAHHRSHERYQ